MTPGCSVSGAGDVNGDGFDDIPIGAFRADPNGSGSGQSYVVFGASTGFPSALLLRRSTARTALRSTASRPMTPGLGR
jgi:hypothetical protein